jgi:hypothetical protein
MRTAPVPQNLIIGAFLFLAAIVFAVSPLPVVYRSLGILLTAYLAFSAGGLPFAYLIAVVAPPVGLITGNADWLVLLPIVISSNLLAMLGLEYAWRYPAIIVSPLLALVPPFVAAVLAHTRLFAVDLPWGVSSGAWLLLHALIALLGVLAAVYLDRKRERLEAVESHHDTSFRADGA